MINLCWWMLMNITSVIVIPSDAFFWFGVEDFGERHAKQKRGAAYQYFNTHRVIIMMTKRTFWEQWWLWLWWAGLLPRDPCPGSLPWGHWWQRTCRRALSTVWGTVVIIIIIIMFVEKIISTMFFSAIQHLPSWTARGRSLGIYTTLNYYRFPW